MLESFIVIGDIHGCDIQLEEILALSKKFNDHRYILLGDYIDRGPNPERVVSIIKNLDGIYLLGNHEEMLIERYSYATSYEEQGHLLMHAAISAESLDWIMTNTAIKAEFKDYIFVHAGLNKSKKISNQNRRDYLWTREISDYYELTNKIVVHGHTIVQNPEIVGNRININTGCGNSGILTALVLPEMEFLNSSISPGKKDNWVQELKELEKELNDLDELGILEEL